MYTRDFRTEPPADIPSGYGGSAFSTPPEAEANAPHEGAIEAGAHPHHRPPPHRGHDLGSWLSRLSLSRLGDLNLRSLLSGDLLLIAVALLLVTGGGDDDCEDSGDLWILLLLLYFMK